MIRYKPTGAVITKHILSKIREAPLFAVDRPLIVRSPPLSIHVFDRVSLGSDRPNGGRSVSGTARFDPEEFTIIPEICFILPGASLRRTHSQRICFRSVRAWTRAVWTIVMSRFPPPSSGMAVPPRTSSSGFRTAATDAATAPSTTYIARSSLVYRFSAPVSGISRVCWLTSIIGSNNRPTVGPPRSVVAEQIEQSAANGT